MTMCNQRRACLASQTGRRIVKIFMNKYILFYFYFIFQFERRIWALSPIDPSRCSQSRPLLLSTSILSLTLDSSTGTQRERPPARSNAIVPDLNALLALHRSSRSDDTFTSLRPPPRGPKKSRPRRPVPLDAVSSGSSTAASSPTA